MIRSELVEKLQGKYHELDTEDIHKIVETIFQEISNAMVEGGRVEIRGFGAFGIRARVPRAARNPRTGAVVHVPAKYHPFFKTGKLLRDRLNNRA